MRPAQNVYPSLYIEAPQTSQLISDQKVNCNSLKRCRLFGKVFDGAIPQVHCTTRKSMWVHSQS